MYTLNDTQRAAAQQLEGTLMVLAGPGSGKTTVITHRAVNLAQHLQPTAGTEKVLVLAFSKAAAVQMEQRYQRLGGLPLCTFGTFHAVFFRILRERYGYAVGQLLQEGEKREIIKKLLLTHGIDADDDTLSAALNEIGFVKNELYELEHYHSQSVGEETFRRIFAAYEQEKHDRNVIDFDDMLVLCHRLLIAEPHIAAQWQRKFPYIMVDEFQDINHVQYECLRILAQPLCNLCVVGDDDQSIYRFRGARPEFFLRLPQDFPDVQRVVLDTNYRSTDEIIAYSNAVIAHNRVRYNKASRGTQRTGAKPLFSVYADPNTEATAIAKLLRKGAVDFDETAVIYRTNIQARAFMDAFMQANIPFIVKDELSVIYEHWVTRDIFSFLRLGQGVAMGYDDIERVVNKPFRFISKAFIQAARESGGILATYSKSPSLNRLQKQRLAELATGIRALKKLPTAKAIAYIRRQLEYDQHIKDFCDYRKISPTPFYEVLYELQEAATEFPVPADFFVHAQNSIEQAKQKKELDDQPRVTLTTMHSAKGLEFGTVYLISAVEGVIPHERSRTEPELEEERRLFYVAATRAKEVLHISTVTSRHESECEPSRFVADMMPKSKKKGK